MFTTCSFNSAVCLLRVVSEVWRTAANFAVTARARPNATMNMRCCSWTTNLNIQRVQRCCRSKVCCDCRQHMQRLRWPRFWVRRRKISAAQCIARSQVGEWAAGGGAGASAAGPDLCAGAGSEPEGRARPQHWMHQQCALGLHLRRRQSRLPATLASMSLSERSTDASSWPLPAAVLPSPWLYSSYLNIRVPDCKWVDDRHDRR